MIIKKMYHTEFSVDEDGYIEIGQKTEYDEQYIVLLSPHQMRKLVEYFENVEKQAESLFSENQ